MREARCSSPSRWWVGLIDSTEKSMKFRLQPSLMPIQSRCARHADALRNGYGIDPTSYLHVFIRPIYLSYASWIAALSFGWYRFQVNSRVCIINHSYGSVVVVTQEWDLGAIKKTWFTDRLVPTRPLFTSLFWSFYEWGGAFVINSAF